MNEILERRERRQADTIVLEQAAQVAGDAVGKIVMASLRAAQTCGCRHCRHAAAETTLWATLLLEPAAVPTAEPAYA
jgi:hypothetical protein